jgi:hypothetical protein
LFEVDLTIFVGVDFIENKLGFFIGEFCIGLFIDRVMELFLVKSFRDFLNFGISIGGFEKRIPEVFNINRVFS